MITVLKRPDPIMLSGNPIDVEIQASGSNGDPVGAAGGTRANFTADAPFGAGVFISLNWTTPDGQSRSVNFHTDGPFASAYEIPDYQGGDVNQYWESVAGTIGTNAEVAPYFTVNATRNIDGSYTVTAIARSADPTWSVAWGPNASSNFTVENDIAGSGDGTYRVRCEVYMDRGNGYELVGRFGTPPNAASRVGFNVGRVIDDAIREVLPLPGIPDFDLSEPIEGPNIFPYYLSLVEYTASDGYGEAVLIEDLLAFAGQVDGSLLSTGNYLEQVSAGNSWLCSRPDRREVGREEPVFLSWVPLGSGTNHPVLEVESTNDENEVATVTLFAGLLTVRDQTPVTFPVGLTALGLADDTLWYRVRVVVNGVAESPWRIFHVDQRDYEEERYLAYLNSFYLPEVIRCTGALSIGNQIGYTSFERVRPLASNAILPGKGTWKVDTVDEYVYATGYKPRLEIIAVIRELVASPYVYQITPNGRTPLLPTGTGFDFGQRTQNLFSAVLPFELGRLEQGAGFGTPAGPGEQPPNTGVDGGDTLPDTGVDPGTPGSAANWENALSGEWTINNEPWYN